MLVRTFAEELIHGPTQVACFLLVFSIPPLWGLWRKHLFSHMPSRIACLGLHRNGCLCYVTHEAVPFLAMTGLQAQVHNL